MQHEGHAEALRRIARRAMVERGLLPEFSPEALAQLSQLDGPARDEVRDLRALPWCSIDNEDSRDLDQLSACEELGGEAIRLLVAVADVDALVAAGTPIDGHAGHNTTSVYTAAVIFPMLPERLSTDLTSLNPAAERVALIIDYTVDGGGEVQSGTIYRARVLSRAQLTYEGVAAWLDEAAPAPAGVAADAELARNLQTQDAAAQRLRKRRLDNGALQLESIEARPVFDGDRVVDLRAQEQNRARQLIEELMVASNGVAAQFLEERRYPSLRRVVRSPERWGKIVALAAEYGETLPGEPDSKALDRFLRARRLADPMRFPDLSLTVVKLMGRGEYVAEAPGEESPGHFGLAVQDYSHTTAPNRRYPDLVTHRQLKAAIASGVPAYGTPELMKIAERCSAMEAAATKVERQVRKSAAALVLSGREGEVFEGVITGAADKGTFVRVFTPPVEGRIVRGERGLKVGDKVRVTLTATDFERGYIDFVRK